MDNGDASIHFCRKLELDETSGSGDFTFEVSLCLTEDCSLPLQPGSVVTLPDFIYVVANLSLVEDEDIVVEVRMIIVLVTFSEVYYRYIFLMR